jgi:hypothetical protein
MSDEPKKMILNDDVLLAAFDRSAHRRDADRTDQALIGEAGVRGLA